MSPLTHHIIFYLVALFLLANSISSVAAINLSSKRYTTISVENGIYTISLSATSSCKLVLGVIAQRNSADLNKLSNSVPSTFTVVKRDAYIEYFYSYTISESSYLVLFNNETSTCSYTTFTSSVETDSSLTSSTTYVNLPYGITKTFKNFFNYNSLVIKSQSSSTINVNVYSSYSSSSLTTPISTPTTSNFKSKTIYGYGTTTVSVTTYSGYNSYIYLNCMTASGCPVYLSTQSSSSNDSVSSAIIGGIIGPIAFIAIFTFIVIISVISTIVTRRRRLFLLAAATSAATTTTYSTQPNYVPVPTAVATTTTEQTTVFVPQNTSIPQPYANQPQPYVTQPQPYYGNQAYYSQPVTSQPQPYQPMAYQPQNPYYNPGVGAYPTNVTTPQQEPMPAFNPNVDRV